MVGQTIKRLRLARGWNQDRLAKALGVDQSQISRLENGEWRPPREVLIRAARAFESPDVLLAALRRSEVLQEALTMLGIDCLNPDPRTLIRKIRDELDMIEADMAGHDRVADAAARAASLCQVLALVLAECERCR